MTLGQLTEIIAMLMLSWLLTMVKLRWVIVAALLLGVVRYGLFAFSGWGGDLIWIWLGIALHGPCYTLFYITGQILVDRRVDPSMRSQAQALLGTLVGGVGGLLGSLFCGWYYADTKGLPPSWVFFWGEFGVAVFG